MVPKESAPEFSNNTFVDNRVAIQINDGVALAGQRFRNNLIFGGNTGLELYFAAGSPSTPENVPVWENNLVFGSVDRFVGMSDPTGTNGNLDVDPKLVNVSTGDLHLEAASPAIDAGTSGGPALPLLDFDAEPRIVDGDGNGTKIVDIGAYEFH